MAYYPQSTSGLNYITYPIGPTATGVTLTANASANTKGTYVELIASTPFACNSVVITVTSTSATAGLQYLFDIATGGSGSETVVIPNLMAEGTNSGTGTIGGSYAIPCAIASGTRIAARCQCSTGGSSMVVEIVLVAAGSMPGIASFTNYGAGITHASGGARVDPGGSANTKGAYTQLSASTSGVIQSLTLMMTLGGATFGTSSSTWCVDLATGGAGSEVVLIPDLRFIADCGTTPRPVVQPRSMTFLTYIAAGTRLAVRASNSITDATNRLCDVAVIAGTAPSEPSGGGGAYPFVG